MKQNLSSHQGQGLNAYKCQSTLAYLSKIYFPQYPLTLFPLTSILYNVHKTKHKRLTVHNLPDSVFHKLSFSADCGKYPDVDSCVLVDCGTLSNLFSNDLPNHSTSWLKLSKYTINSMGRQCVKSCLVKVIGTNDVDETYIIASETTHFNIKQKLGFDFDVDQLKVWVSHIKPNDFDSNISTDLQFTPHTATKASVALIQSPFDMDQTIIDSLLTSYFSVKRYLCLGDLFSVNVLKYCPHLHFSAIIPTATIYFKVLEVEGMMVYNAQIILTTYGYVIEKGSTKLLQSTNQRGYLPPSLTFCCSSNNFQIKCFKSQLLLHCPTGLHNTFNELIVSFRPFVYCDFKKVQGLRPVFLLCGPTGVGKQKVIGSVAKALGLHVWSLDCLELKGSTPGYTEGKLKFIFKQCVLLQPCIVVLKNIDSFCLDNDGNEDARVISAIHEQISDLFNETHRIFPILLVGTCNSKSRNLSSITPGLARAFLHVIYMDAPSENDREALLNWILQRSSLQIADDVLLSQIASQSSGLLYEDLKALVAQAIRIHYTNLKLLDPEKLKHLKKNCLLLKDFEDAFDLMHGAYSDAIGAPKIPAVSWSDIGGLAPLKEEITRTITMPLLHPALVASGLKRSGILLFGPPGTGKTMLAKAVATECNLNFLSVKGPELLNMYVGQSEENVREVFERARAAAPCIIFFDELDSLAPNRGKSGDSAGVMDRVVSQLLAEMDGMQKSTHLYVIGATNRPDLIDPALLRPGRFDKLLYVGVCEDHSAQLSVMAALTRKFDLSGDVNLENIVSLLPSNLTGADLFSVCSNAWRNAAKRIIQTYKSDGTESSNTPELIVVNTEDFKAAALDLSPSVSAKDLQYFHHLHRKLVTK